MKLLLVEDSERLQRSLSTGLKKHGFALDQAFDGEQALAYTAVNQYDAIILDLMLPTIDGLTVLSTLRGEGNDYHVLILSAKDQTEDRVRGLDLGADELRTPLSELKTLAEVAGMVPEDREQVVSLFNDIGEISAQMEKMKACIRHSSGYHRTIKFGYNRI